jgi:fructokinase
MHAPGPAQRAVVCFGEALIDFLAQPPLSATAPRQFTAFAGGAPANVAVAVARLGGAARFVGMLGEDLFGELLAGEFTRAGVDIRCAPRTAAARTALAFVALDAHGERSFSFYRPPAADLMFRETHLSAQCFENAAVWHVCSNSLTEEPIAAATLAGMRRARAAGALLSMDLNLRRSLWAAGVDPTPRLWAALGEADLVKLAAGELEFLATACGSSDAVLERLFAARTRCLLVTDGAAPVRWFTPLAHGTVATFTVAVLDTTAAGDAFVGGWLKSLADAGVERSNLAAWLHGPALQASVRFAAACGALTTTRHGAFAAMPQAHEVQLLLQA